jgi:hypothetical protein
MGPLMRLILGLGVLVLIMAAVAFGLPAHVTVARSKVINAPEHVIYPYLSNLRRFPDWSPWAARDPDMRMTYSGPPEGKGAKVEWVSEEPSIGTGAIEIVGTNQPRSLDMTANFNGLAGTSSYTLSPAGAGSKVTWSFGYETGSSPLKRWQALMLDGFIGAEYNTGLEKLKAKVEADRAPTTRRVLTPPAPPPSGETVVPQTPAQGAQPAAPAEQPAAEAAPQDGRPPPPPRRR